MIKTATNADSNTLAEMAIEMWNSSSIAELETEFSKIISSRTAVCFIKCLDDIPVGFAQCTLRNDYVEGTDSSPVGYLEGVFVKEQYRNKGYAKELLLACEKWAKNMGCSEFASDCELTNVNSLKFHLVQYKSSNPMQKSIAKLLLFLYNKAEGSGVIPIGLTHPLDKLSTASYCMHSSKQVEA